MKTEVSLYLLIKLNDIHYKIGKIIINSKIGELYYIPSENIVISTNHKISNEYIKKFSFHSSGRVHAETVRNDVLEYGLGESDPKNNRKRQEVKNIGYQDMVCETIFDVSKLPIHKKTILKKDIVLNTNTYIGAVKLFISIISGKNIISYHEGKKSGIKKTQLDKEMILDKTSRGFSDKQGLSDKLMQFILIKNVNEKNKNNRRIFIPECQKVSSS